MSEAKRLLKLIEADVSDHDKALLRALGIQAPDDWQDRSHFDDVASVNKLFWQPAANDGIPDAESTYKGAPEKGTRDKRTLIVDCETAHKERLMMGIESLPGVFDVQDGGAYREDPSYSQIWVETELSVAELEHDLYNERWANGWVGVVEK